MAQNSVPVFLSGGQAKTRPNMVAWRYKPAKARRELMAPGECKVYTREEAQQKVASR